MTSKPPRRPWTHKEIAFLRSAYGTLSLGEIGRHIDRPARNVGCKAVKLGIARKHFRMTDDALAELVRLVGLGWSETDIAERLGTNYRTVREHRRRLGLPGQRFSERNRRKVAERTKQQCETEGVKSLVEIRWLKRRIEGMRKGRDVTANG